jgi:hypothetical protein
LSKPKYCYQAAFWADHVACSIVFDHGRIRVLMADHSTWHFQRFIYQLLTLWRLIFIRQDWMKLGSSVLRDCLNQILTVLQFFCKFDQQLRRRNAGQSARVFKLFSPISMKICLKHWLKKLELNKCQTMDNFSILLIA